MTIAPAWVARVLGAVTMVVRHHEFIPEPLAIN
eukprot:COSAG02_NODE_62183_length_266_cov_0.934132_1_plen_32_part_10